MFVCLCNGITDQSVRDAVLEDKNALDIADELGVGTNCGTCLDYFYELVAQTKENPSTATVDQTQSNAYRKANNSNDSSERQENDDTLAINEHKASNVTQLFGYAVT